MLGFGGRFTCADDGLLCCEICGLCHDQHGVRVTCTTLGDGTTVLALRCPCCRHQGTAVIPATTTDGPSARLCRCRGLGQARPAWFRCSPNSGVRNHTTGNEERAGATKETLMTTPLRASLPDPMPPQPSVPDPTPEPGPTPVPEPVPERQA